MKSGDFILSLLLGTLLWGCTFNQMAEDAKIRPFDPSPVFDDDRSARPPVPGTIARGQLHEDSWLWEGERDGIEVAGFPFPITGEDLLRGQERFEIHCSPCHGSTGIGDGRIVQRGFPKPPSYFEKRLRQLPEGNLFRTISYGYGAMPAYGPNIEVHDRWRIVAYIRALQESREVPLSELAPNNLEAFEKAVEP